jgi:hypothetical protein
MTPQERFDKAKAAMTRAAEAELEGNPLAGDLAWFALAELEAAKAALAEAERHAQSRRAG